MSQTDLNEKLNQLRKEYKTAKAERKTEIFAEAQILKNKKTICYLDGCLEEADSELIAFCSEEHKDKYNRLNDLELERKGIMNIHKNLPIEYIQRRLVQMGKEGKIKKTGFVKVGKEKVHVTVLPEYDSFDAAKEIFKNEKNEFNKTV